MCIFPVRMEKGTKKPFLCQRQFTVQKGKFLNTAQCMCYIGGHGQRTVEVGWKELTLGRKKPTERINLRMKADYKLRYEFK